MEECDFHRLAREVDHQLHNNHFREVSERVHRGLIARLECAENALKEVLAS